MSRTLAVVFGALWFITSAVLAYVVIDAAHFQSDLTSQIQLQNAEIDSLRELVERVDAGEPTKVAFAAAGGGDVQQDGGWLVAGPLAATFQEEDLTAICGSSYLADDTCRKAVRHD